MQRALKRAISRLVASDIVWTCLDSTVLRLARYAELARKNAKAAAPPAVLDAVQQVCPDLTVRHGTFKGMRYPSAATRGSTLFPKLLGSYERELHPILEIICAEQYSEIVDVGCAEGYYAVGLARRMPNARVFAFDVNDDATELCRQMAAVNGVADRVSTAAFCSPETLKSLNLSRALIISDCEGFEKELFTEDVVTHLARHDVLIELHDFVDISISPTLRARFEKTHDLTVIQSVDDVKKAHDYSYDELAPFDLRTRRFLLGEFRPTAMEWFYLRSRSTLAATGPGSRANAVG